MIGSEINVVLNKDLSQADCEKISKEISGVKGVYSAHFNEKAGNIRVHYTGLEEVCKEIKKLEGVSGFNHDGIHDTM